MWIEAGAEVGGALVEGIINENEDENDNIKKKNVREKGDREGEGFHKDKEVCMECRVCGILQTVCY